METKKSSKANLEKTKSINLLLGIVVSLATLFVSFEWGTREVTILIADKDGGIEWVEEIPFTMTEPTPPPPPPPPQPVVTDILNVVDDDKIVIDAPIITTEDDPNAAQPDIYQPPVTLEEEEEDVNKVFIAVEKMPMFPGGDPGLLQFVNKSIKYPVIAQENGIQGRVVCSFVVNRDGSVVDAEVIKGIDPALDKEALRVINSMPKWEPGRQSGKPVRVRYTIPIIFRLQ